MSNDASDRAFFAARQAAAGGEVGIRDLLFALTLLALVAFLPRLLRRLRQTGPKADKVVMLQIITRAESVRS